MSQTKNQTIPQPIESDFILVTNLKDFHRIITKVNKRGYHKYAYKIHSPYDDTYHQVSIRLTKYGFIQVEYNHCTIYDGENFIRAAQLYNNPSVSGLRPPLLKRNKKK